jgi:hypothetical protein
MKQTRFPLRLCAVCLMLLTSCAPTLTASEKQPVSTQTESPAPTLEATRFSGSSYTNPVYKLEFPDLISFWSIIPTTPMGRPMATP